MGIDADRLAQQVKLAYEFMDALHGQAIALVKDVEAQLAEAPEELTCVRPGGYRYTINPLSMGLDRPRTVIADYYSLFFHYFAQREKTIPLDGDVRSIAFVKVVLREHELRHPEVRLGVMTGVTKPPDLAGKWPKKFEELVSRLSHRALTRPAWSGRGTVEQLYQSSYVSLTVRGEGVRLSELPDSEAVANRVVNPLLKMYREATQ